MAGLMQQTQVGMEHADVRLLRMVPLTMIFRIQQGHECSLPQQIMPKVADEASRATVQATSFNGGWLSNAMISRLRSQTPVDLDIDARRAKGHGIGQQELPRSTLPAECLS